MDIRLPRPDHWVDRSMVVLSAPEPTEGGVAPNMVVTRDRLGPDDVGEDKERIRSFADRQLGFMRDQLVDPVVHSRRLVRIADRRAAEVIVSWTSSGVRLTQLVTFIMRDQERVAIATATATEAEFATHEPTFRGMLERIEL